MTKREAQIKLMEKVARLSDEQLLDGIAMIGSGTPEQKIVENYLHDEYIERFGEAAYEMLLDSMEA